MAPVDIDGPSLWVVIVGLAVGSFLLRFVFIGFVGSRPMPDWMLRHLRYTAVAILPAICAPLVVWPQATGGDPDPVRLSAAAATIAVGLWTRHVILAAAAGMAVLLALPAAFL